MSSFFVSICIPAYNHPHLLKRCLESIVLQKYTHFEVIVTDDSPHDLLKIVVSELNDARIKYFKNIEPLGSPQNWNYCISKAQGDIVKILHHDDWFYDENSLDKFVEIFIKNPNLDFVFSQCYNVTPTFKKLFAHPVDRFKYVIQHPELLFFFNTIGAPSTVAISKKVASSIKFNETSSWYVDIIYYIEVFRAFNNIEYLKLPLVNVTAGSDLQVTNTISGLKKISEAIFTLEKFSFFSDKKFSFLIHLHLTELFRRYNIKHLSVLTLSNNSIATLAKMKIPLLLAKLPVNYRLYALIRIFTIKYIIK